jgi:transitional endoplasmic reticulum ATPase
MPKFYGTGLEYLACKYAYAFLSGFDAEELNDLVNCHILARVAGKPSFRRRKLSPAQCVKELCGIDRAKPKTKLVCDNALFLTKMLQLPETAAKLVQLIIVINGHSALANMLSGIFDNQDFITLEGFIIDTLAVSPLLMKQVVQQMDEYGLLEVYGLDGIDGLRIPEPLILKLTGEKLESKEQLLSSVLVKSQPAKFCVESFSHLQVQLLQQYLAKATEQNIKGVNILLYGPPGVGKTELARALAQELQRFLLEIRAVSVGASKFVENDRHTKTDQQRLNYLQFVQKILDEQHNSVLLVDECESLFLAADVHYSKEMLHRLLESNNAPTIWITNHIHCIEESFIRRFKLVQEVPSPGKHQARTLTASACADLTVSEQFIDELSTRPMLSHAQIANSTEVARTLEVSGKAAEEVIDSVIKSSMKAMGSFNNKPSYQHSMQFDPNLLNIKQNKSELEQVHLAVAAGYSVRVVLTGAPGTGKTAFAHHVAQQCQRELVQVKCSDVLSKYVGESEQNLAKLFQTAHQQQQILLLDEVDSLLCSRDRLNSHHQVQLVNELLTHLECFSQPLFAATNFVNLLDQAVLRRFDFKLECDFLTSPQVLQLFLKLFPDPQPEPQEIVRLGQLNALTPGDFAIVSRRLKFVSGIDHRSAALDILEGENQRKHMKGRIGF